MHESHWIAGFAGWIGRKYGIPVVSKVATFPALPEIAGPLLLKPLWERERRKISYIALSRALGDELLEEGIDAQRIHVISNGVDLPDQTAQPDRYRNILFIGNFLQGMRKGFDLLFPAWNAICREFPESRLVMLGGGDAECWKRFVQEHEMQGSVEFVGFTTDIESYILSSACLVLPSRFEGMSNALLEAMSYGLPAVVSDILANTELVSDRANGLVVPVEDAAQLARAMKEMLMQPELRKEWGAAAQQVIRDRYAIESVVARISDLYGHMMKVD